MKEEELIIADIVLLKIPMGRHISIYSLMQSNTILNGIEEKYSLETCDKIRTFYATRRSHNTIRDFFLREGYIMLAHGTTSYDILTEKGIKAQAAGGHKNYIKQEKKKNRWEWLGNFPKKKWFIYEPSKWLIAMLIGFIIRDRGNCNVNENILLKSIPKGMKISPLKPYLDSSKISNKKDTLLKLIDTPQIVHH